MPREFALFGILIPTLLPLFILSIGLQTLLDRVLGWLGVYRMVWHPVAGAAVHLHRHLRRAGFIAVQITFK